MFFCIRFLNRNTMYVVVGAEWNDFEVRGDVVDDASADAVDVEVVGIHECHAT